MAKNSCQKVPKSDFQSQFTTSKIIRIFLKKFLLENINLGTHFLFLLILCTIKIEPLSFLKFLKNLAFFDSYFWPFDKSQERVDYAHHILRPYFFRSGLQLLVMMQKPSSTIKMQFEIFKRRQDFPVYNAVKLFLNG